MKIPVSILLLTGLLITLGACSDNDTSGSYVRLPTIPDDYTEVTDIKGTMVINIGQDRDIQVRDNSLSLDALAKKIIENKKYWDDSGRLKDSSFRVILRADRDTPWQDIVNILSVVQQTIPMDDFRIAVSEEEIVLVDGKWSIAREGRWQPFPCTLNPEPHKPEKLDP